MTELLLRLDERRARQHEHRVLVRQPARHLDVVLVGEAGADRDGLDRPAPQREYDVPAGPVARLPARRAPPPPPPPPPPAEHPGEQRPAGRRRPCAAPHPRERPPPPPARPPPPHPARPPP